MKDKLRFRRGDHGFLVLQINIKGVWLDVDLNELERV
jgi:hypothetical protein